MTTIIIIIIIIIITISCNLSHCTTGKVHFRVGQGDIVWCFSVYVCVCVCVCVCVHAGRPRGTQEMSQLHGETHTHSREWQSCAASCGGVNARGASPRVGTD